MLEEVFKGKELWLATRLNVTDSFLHALNSRGLIDGDRVECIKNASSNFQKVDQLSSALRQCNDAKFVDFCDILESQNLPVTMTWPQIDIPRFNRISGKLEVMFKEIFDGKKNG